MKRDCSRGCVNSDGKTLVDFLKTDAPDPFAKAELFTAFLDDWKSKGTYSYHRLVTSGCGSRARVRDNAGREREVIVLASNNYLGLNMRAEVREAAARALEKYGTGMCGSRFLSGTYDLVEELERELAEFEGCGEAIVFTTGYQANVGAIAALARPGDVVLIDRLCHASIVDGCRMSESGYRAFRHNDPESLARLLSKCKDKYRGKLIVVDGVFSMDGDLAVLPDIVAVAAEHGARIVVDEAHATGVLGQSGRGTVEHFGLEESVDLIIGTFSKTFGATGGYMAGPREVVTYVRHYGRSYMFSASPAPATIAGVLAALRIMRREPDLRRKLWDNVSRLYNGLKAAGCRVFPDPPQSAVITVPVGADAVIRAMGVDLFDAGLFTSSVVYPAVAPNHARLRLSVSAAHSATDIDEALQILGSVCRKHNVIGGTIDESAPYSAVAVG